MSSCHDVLRMQRWQLASTNATRPQRPAPAAVLMVPRTMCCRRLGSSGALAYELETNLHMVLRPLTGQAVPGPPRWQLDFVRLQAGFLALQERLAAGGNKLSG